MSNCRQLLTFAIAAIFVAALLASVQLREVANERSMHCVSPAYDRVAGDLQARDLVYETSTEKSDDDALFSRFRAKALTLVNQENAGSTSGGRPLYLHLTVGFHFDRGIYEHLATAIVCEQAHDRDFTKCRNRTYFFFQRTAPEVLAQVLIEDIVRVEPVVRDCGY